MKKLGQENCVFSEMTDTEAELETKFYLINKFRQRNLTQFIHFLFYCTRRGMALNLHSNFYCLTFL